MNLRSRTVTGIITVAMAVHIVTVAHAGVKCANLSKNMTCGSYSYSNYHPEWSIPCTGNGQTVTVQGVGFCAGNGGSYAVAGTPKYSTDPENTPNKYCWCKMTSPAVSAWVFIHDRGSAASCAISCADACALHVRHYSDFRGALFSGLGD